MKRGRDIIDGIFKCGVKVDYLFQLKIEVWKYLSNSVDGGSGRAKEKWIRYGVHHLPSGFCIFPSRHGSKQPPER